MIFLKSLKTLGHNFFAERPLERFRRLQSGPSAMAGHGELCSSRNPAMEVHGGGKKRGEIERGSRAILGYTLLGSEVAGRGSPAEAESLARWSSSAVVVRRRREGAVGLGSFRGPRGIRSGGQFGRRRGPRGNSTVSSSLLLMVAKEVTVVMTDGGREAGRAIYRPERIELGLLKLVDTRRAAGRFPMAAGGRGARHAPERRGTCGRGQRRGKAAAGGACARRVGKGVALQRRRR